MSEDLPDGARTRQIAAQLVRTVLKRRQTLDEAMAGERRLAGLSPPDQGFVRAMLVASFRELGRFDIALSQLLDRPFSALDPPVQALLRIGAAQLWRLDTPPHAAVAATVEAARHDPASRRASGLVNAVLRRAADSREVFEATPVLDVWPTWLQQAMTESLGADRARSLAAAQLRRPQLHLTARHPSETAAQLGGQVLAGGSVALDMQPVETLPGYSAGCWWVQDAAAALPARILAARPGETVIDLCAAPGGKTLQLAAAGANVIAVDRSASRLQRLRANLERTGLAGQVDIVAARAEDWRPDRPADAVLLDAPCSALGTLARHPEGAWIKRPEDIAGFAPLQRRLLAAAREMLRPGGRLVYCVCTPLQAEGPDIVAAALATGAWQRNPIPETASPGFGHCLTPAGDLLTLAGADGGHDAFFVARLAPAQE